MSTRWISVFYIIFSLSLTACSQEQSAGEYIQNGKSFIEKKEWKSAIIEFKNAAQREPENAQVRALLGKAYLETLSIQAAIIELGRARDLGHDPKDILIPLGKAYAVGREHQTILDEITVKSDYSDALKANILALRGVAYLGLKKNDDAVKALNEARQYDKNSADVRLAWAIFEKQNGNTEAQISWLKPLLERDGGNADAWSMMGEIENKKGNFEAAEKAYSRSIELRQYTHFDMARRALVFVAQNKLEEARAEIDTLKQAGANWPLVGHIDGALLLRNEKTDEAKSVFQEVLSKAPGYPPSQYMLALIYFNDRNFQNAASLLEQYLASEPNEIRAGKLYASALLQLNQVEKAQSLLEGLRTQYPEDANVLSLLGNVYLRQKQTKKSIEVLKKAVELAPDEAGSRLQLGASLLENKSTLAQGQQELIKAIELNPDLLQAEIALFRSYVAEKRYSDARQIANKLDKKNKDSSQGANLYVLTLFAEGKKEEAVKYLRNTLKRFPGDIVTSNNLARVYLRDNKLDDAKALYEKVLEKTPTDLQTLHQLALIAAREGDQEQLMLRLKQAQERNEEEISPRLVLASQYLKQGKASLAAQLLNEAQQDQKELPAYILLMAQAKLGVNEHQHAIRSLKQLITDKPDISAAHFLLAQGYAQAKDARQMRESLNNTIAIAPEHLSANIILARLDLSERKVDAFKDRVVFLEKKYPDNADVQFLKAKSASGDSDFDAAIGTLTSLMEQTPHSNVIIDLSKNQWVSGDKQGAISGLELWIQSHADDTRALKLLGGFYLADNQFDEARATYEKLIAQTQDDPEVFNNLAYLLQDSNPQKGIEYAQKALELAPDNALIQDTLAMLYLEAGEKSKALEISAQAAKKMPKMADIQLNYAKVLVANNQKEEARNALNDLYKITQSESVRKRITDELNKLN